MKNKPLSIVLILLSCSLAFAEVPVSINYAGHIEGADGKLEAKVMPMAFRLYDRPGHGLTAEKATALWGRQTSVALTDGDFDVDLKDALGTRLANTRYASLSDALVAALHEGTGELYVGLTPANDANAEIYPRLRLTTVLHAVQARSMRTMPDGFSATNGLFSVEKALVVNGATTLHGDTVYGATAFGPSSTADFKGGVSVAGTLRANAVTAYTLEADTMAVTKAETVGSGALAVSGTLAVPGSAVWNGDIRDKVGTNAASRVVGAVEAGDVTVETLAAKNFVNNVTTSNLCDHVGTWNMICDWQTVDAVVEVAERHDMTVYDPRRGVKVTCKSISAGSWVAPCDCLALFQTCIYNRMAIDPACIQFYIVPSPQFSGFNAVSPNGVAMVSNGNGATLETVVPLLLRKGQLVKWLCYNNNSGLTGIEETDQTNVKGISYQPFGWSE